jgi:hypothetical protein
VIKMDNDYQNFVDRMGSFEDTMDLSTNSKELKHYGILGMKWGKHTSSRTPEQLGKIKGNVDNASNIIKETKNINNSVNSMKSASKKIDLSSMDDKELKDRVARMNLEKQYSSLSNDQTTKGQLYVKNTLEIAGSALAITSSALGIALAIKQLKG